MLDEDLDLHFAGFEPHDFQMLKTVCRKMIPTMVTKSFLRRKLQNRFRLATNQERVAAVTQSGGGGETKNISIARLH